MASTVTAMVRHLLLVPPKRPRPVAVETERITVVSCADWPVVGCGFRPDELGAVVVANRVVAASGAAQSLGVVAGLRRREAQRRAPGLIVKPPDESNEARAFAPVLAALDDITPRIEIDRPGQCAFLTRGPSRYFGGDQAMSERVTAEVGETLQGSTSVCVGTADSRFGALQAAAAARSVGGKAGFHVVAAGDTARFLAPLPVVVLAVEQAQASTSGDLIDLVDVLKRLGLHTLGAFAELEPADVLARFGGVGMQAHLWSRGRDDRQATPRDIPPDLEASIELEPPVHRVDQAAFIAKTLADEFIRQLGTRGASCARIAIIAETEHGEQQQRLWRAREAFDAVAIAERMRWQLDGWLSAPIRSRPTGGLSRLTLRPDDLSVAAGRQLDFWGNEVGLAERAARAVARVQGLVGPGVALVPEVRGGRSSEDGVVTIPAESVDLVERATSVDRAMVGAAVVDMLAVAGVLHSDLKSDDKWLGRLPAPAPTMVHDPMVPVRLVDTAGELVVITSRGLMENEPAVMTSGRGAVHKVVGWSGPWLLDERWWHRDRHRRQARMQVVLDDGRALIVTCVQGAWAVEASYD